LRGFDSDYDLYERGADVKKFYISWRVSAAGRILAPRLAPTMSHELISHASNGDDQFGPLWILF
jgi:hypothetical protein